MIVDVDRYGTFELSPEFLEGYKDRPVPWGFGALSWVTYMRTYSRVGEQWWQICKRVIEGTVTIQRAHCLERGLRIGKASPWLLTWNLRVARRRAVPTCCISTAPARR